VRILRPLGAGALLAALFLPAASPPPPLGLPLPFFEGCTSSFGEYRRTHFHGGLDFRTRQTVGWPCLAPADGRVVRIRREAGGYGRVLYLELDDGRTAVYGHLCRFEERSLGLESALRRACEAAGTSFPGDVVPKPVPRVRRGEVVAYSGDLGVGSPHLHFEVRRGDDLLDPLAEGLALPLPPEAPVLEGVVFEPLSPEGRVEGAFGPRFYPARRWGKDSYTAGPARISGPVEAYVLAKDRLGVPSNAVGVPRLSASWDGAPVFTMDLGRIGLDRYKDSPLLFDPGLFREGATAYRLRKMPGMRVEGIAGSGIPEGPSAGSHRLSVEAANRLGGKAVLEVEVAVPADPPGSIRTSLPGSGYLLERVEPAAAGLRLLLKRRSRQGETALRLGDRPARGIRVGEGPEGAVEALLPREELPREGLPLRLGENDTGYRVAAGPGGVDLDGVRLLLPAGTSGFLRRGSRSAGEGLRVEVSAGPFAPALSASLIFPGHPADGSLGVFQGGRFLDLWSGKPVAYPGAGTVSLRRDQTPPSWGSVAVRKIPNLGIPELVLPVADGDTRPNPRSASLEVDGRQAFFDWDPDTGELRVDLSGMAPGRHTVSGRIRDFAGNLAVLPPRAFQIPR